MNVERKAFESDGTPEAAAGPEERIDAAAERARRDPRFAHLFAPLTPEQDAANLARAEADFAAGRFMPHEDVARWLKTVGTPDFKPMPPEWFE